MSVLRTPNENGSAPEVTQSESDMLLEEMAYSPAFRAFLNEIVQPIVLDIRSELLRSIEISEAKRAQHVGKLAVLEDVFRSLFARTADGNVPEGLANFFK